MSWRVRTPTIKHMSAALGPLDAVLGGDRPEPDLPFGTVIYRLRMTLGISQRELARRCCFSVATISELENLRRLPPRPDRVAALAAALTDRAQVRDQVLKLAAAERRALNGLRISRHTPPRVAALLREIAMSGDRLQDRHIAALRAQLMEVVHPP